MKAESIQKEIISHLQFPKHEVLSELNKKLERYQQLQNAMRYGNTLRQKVKIYFRDASMLKVVETTVWYADENHVILKGGTVLPVVRITSVEI